MIRAAAQSLKENPKVNAAWYGDRIRINHNINIGVAVAVEDGLLVPVVRNADKKSFAEIAGEVKVFAQKAKDKNFNLAIGKEIHSQFQILECSVLNLLQQLLILQTLVFLPLAE